MTDQAQKTPEERELMGTQLGEILAGRCQETGEMYQQSVACSASINPSAFADLLKTYEGVGNKFNEALQKNGMVRGGPEPQMAVSDFLDKKIDGSVTIKLNTYRDLNAFIAAIGLGLTQLSFAVSIQLPLQGHILDVDGLREKLKEPQNGQEVATKPEEERNAVDDTVGVAGDSGQARGGGSGPGSDAPAGDGGASLDASGLGDGGGGPVPQG